MKMTISILLLIIAILVFYIVKNRPTEAISNNAYNEIIDSLNHQISVFESFIEMKLESRDSLDNDALKILGVKHSVLKEIENYNPAQAIQYFDSITPGKVPSKLNGEQITTDYSRIHAANLSITENKFLYAQNHNMSLIIDNLDAQILYEKEIRSLANQKFSECENHIQQLTQQNEQLRKRFKWSNRIASATSIATIILVIIQTTS